MPATANIASGKTSVWLKPARTLRTFVGRTRHVGSLGDEVGVSAKRPIGDEHQPADRAPQGWCLG